MAPPLLYSMASGGFMNTMTTSTKLTLTLVAMALLSACAPRGNSSGVSDLSSRLADSTTSSKPVAYCNQTSNAGTTVKLRAYTDANGAVVNQYMILRFSELSSTFVSGSGSISMFKWLANPGGSTHIDQTALRFKIMNPSTNSSLTDWKTSLRWSDVSLTAANLGYGDATSFFNAMKIIVDLQDANGDYDVLKVATYNSSNAVSSEVNALLPMFYASPADYAYEVNGSARASVLKSLHPFASQASQSTTAAQFATMAQSFCF